MMYILRPLLCVLLVFDVVSGYGIGPPESACESMFPTGHLVGAQATDSPYQITASQESYVANDVITVTITGAGGVTFNGFYLQARRIDPTLDTDEAIGIFSAPIAGTKLTCSEGCVSHNSPDAKSSITATWTAPATVAGHLQFRATIVGDVKETFWFGVTSDTVNDTSASAIGTTTPRATIGDIAAFDLSGCGTTKSCLQSPSGAVLTWALNGDVVDMEFSGKSDGWIAFGLSLDDQMGSDSVTLCIKDGDFVDVLQAYNENRNGPAILENDVLGLTNYRGFYEEGEIRCTFSRSVNEDHERYYNTDATQLYTILMAWGPASSGIPRKHEASPLKSTTEADLRKTDQDLTLKAEDEYFLKAHAACMVAAWMVCASLGLLLARYYRPAFPDTELCKNKVWFQLHRLCMVLTLLLTIAGFVVIFVDVEDLTDEASYDPEYLRAHPILGIIVMGLVVANPIMAMFRCHPDGANRYIYNWAHWLVGTSAHIAGLANIFLGLGFDRADRITPDYLKYVMVAFVVVHALTQLILEVKKCSTDNAIRVREEEIEMTNMSGKPYIDSKGGDPKLELARYVKQSLRFQYVVLIIYIWVVLALGGVMIGSIIKGDD